MIAVDTNVLVRLLVNDPNAPEQSQQARELLNAQGEVWVGQIVLIETIWVLAVINLAKSRLFQF